MPRRTGSPTGDHVTDSTSTENQPGRGGRFVGAFHRWMQRHFYWCIHAPEDTGVALFVSNGQWQSFRGLKGCEIDNILEKNWPEKGV
jgi:hypothetical protein